MLPEEEKGGESEVVEWLEEQQGVGGVHLCFTYSTLSRISAGPLLSVGQIDVKLVVYW